MAPLPETPAAGPLVINRSGTVAARRGTTIPFGLLGPGRRVTYTVTVGAPKRRAARARAEVVCDGRRVAVRTFTRNVRTRTLDVPNLGPAECTARIVSTASGAPELQRAPAPRRRGVTRRLSSARHVLRPDSSPPIPAIRGAAVAHDQLVLEASDGNRFAAFEATPDRPTGIGIAILPDVRGLSRFYEELALRFAERGYTAIAFDYFGRTAGVGKREEDFEYREHVQQTTTAGVQADLAAVIARLREANSVVFTVGFCFGGRQSWLAAAEGHDLHGAIGFYGRRAWPRTARPARLSGQVSSRGRSSG